MQELQVDIPAPLSKYRAIVGGAHKYSPSPARHSVQAEAPKAGSGQFIDCVLSCHDQGRDEGGSGRPAASLEEEQ
jgi:hypothetical protein